MPAILIFKLPIAASGFKQELCAKAVASVAAILVILFALLPFSADYATFFREYKSVRYFATPITPIYSFIKLSGRAMPRHLAARAIPARYDFDDAVNAAREDGYELIVMIVGETARADHLALNGYERQTTPRLAATEHLVSFSNFSSCGTSTAVSVPCMFSPFGRQEFSDEAIFSTENVLGVLTRNNVAVLWRDNNSSSKGVADRVTYQSFKHAGINPVCNPECRDEGMLAGLDGYIASHAGQDIFIILHAMGSHGPEYYKRYPKSL